MCLGSVLEENGLSCPMAGGIFLDQGLNSCPLHWQADSQPLDHQGSPHLAFLGCYLWFIRKKTIMFYTFKRQTLNNYPLHSVLQDSSIAGMRGERGMGLALCTQWLSSLRSNPVLWVSDAGRGSQGLSQAKRGTSFKSRSQVPQ